MIDTVFLLEGKETNIKSHRSNMNYQYSYNMNNIAAKTMEISKI